jgi:hypothetical protein
MADIMPAIFFGGTFGAHRRDDDTIEANIRNI